MHRTRTWLALIGAALALIALFVVFRKDKDLIAALSAAGTVAAAGFTAFAAFAAWQAASEATRPVSRRGSPSHASSSPQSTRGSAWSMGSSSAG